MPHAPGDGARALALFIYMWLARIGAFCQWLRDERFIKSVMRTVLRHPCLCIRRYKSLNHAAQDIATGPHWHIPSGWVSRMEWPSSEGIYGPHSSKPEVVWTVNHLDITAVMYDGGAGTATDWRAFPSVDQGQVHANGTDVCLKFGPCSRTSPTAAKPYCTHCGHPLEDGPTGGCAVNMVCNRCRINFGCLS